MDGAERNAAGRRRDEDPRMAAADARERERQRAMTPSERLAEAIALSRTATRLAANAGDARR